MVDELQYLGLMVGCLIITLPLELVVGARVWRRPRRLALTLLPAVAIFVVWDLVAIARDHWTFSHRYVTGVELPGSLPLEELVFFLVIPICGLLTLEAVRTLLHDEPRAALTARARSERSRAERSTAGASVPEPTDA